jgi:muramidase (phage lysozyme)
VSDPIELVAALDHPNVRAFLRMIRHGEGTADEAGYRRMFGGELFDSFADHPRRVITRTFGGRPISSTAAGAPQFVERTWDGLVKQYGFVDFSPKNQDLGCVALIAGRKALDDVIAGRFDQAVMKCNKEWASLPGSPYGQPVVTMARARQEYEAHGGTYAPDVPDLLPLVQLEQGATPPNPFPTQEASMPIPAFVAAALPALVQAVPELIRMLGSGSETSERNAKAAEVAVAIAKEAIGAKNEQELVETLQADPQAAATVRQAVQDQWFKLEEVGGGIQAAREFSLKAQGDKGIGHNPAVWITVLLLPLVYGVVYAVLTGDLKSFSAEVKSMVVAAIVSGVLGSILGYWLGTSASSKAKDDALLRR